MANGRNENRNEWARLTQGDDYAALHQQTYVPGGHGQVQSYDPSEGYFPAQGYAPAGSYDGYAGSSNSYISPYSAHDSQGMGSNILGADEILEQKFGDIISPQPRKRKSRAPATPEATPKSRRSILREHIARENHGEVSAADQPKGLVEWRNGVFMWWDPEDKKWLRAAYHDEFRDKFIEEDYEAAGGYTVAPARGRGANDVTSSCSYFNQLEWNFNQEEGKSIRDTWGNVVDMDGNKVLYLINRPVNQSYDPPERRWIHDGLVLLDGENNPVRPWVGVPRCFSSKIEGGRMEALRRILPMTIQDFRARMPRFVQTSTGLRPLSLPSTFGHRLSRFRDRYQIPAFLTRAASDVRRNQIIDELPKNEEATTTEGLQVLTRHQIERRKLSTRGKFLYKANGRAISEDERRMRDKKLHQKLARQAEALQQAQSMPATPRQRSAPQSPHLAIPPSSANSKRRRQLDDLEDIDPDRGEPVAKRVRRGATSLDRSIGSPLSTLFEDDGEQVPQDHEAANATATASNNTPLPTELDYRFIEPETPLHQLRIQAALFYPRAHFYALIREHPPHTSEGTYADQYFKIITLLAQKWLLPGQIPFLADIGEWPGSFDAIPVPNLDDGAIWSILNPGPIATEPDDAQGGSAVEANAENDGTNQGAGLGSPGAIATGSDDSQRGSAVDANAENDGTNQGAEVGAGDDAEWDVDFFDQFLENEDGGGELFGMNHNEFLG